MPFRHSGKNHSPCLEEYGFVELEVFSDVDVVVPREDLFFDHRAVRVGEQHRLIFLVVLQDVVLPAEIGVEVPHFEEIFDPDDVC